MARQAEVEREKRAKIIGAEGELLAAAALGEASDTMMTLHDHRDLHRNSLRDQPCDCASNLMVRW